MVVSIQMRKFRIYTARQAIISGVGGAVFLRGPFIAIERIVERVKRSLLSRPWV